MIAPQSVARPATEGDAAPTTTFSTSETAIAGLRAITLPPTVRKVPKLCNEERNFGAIVPGTLLGFRRAIMAGILLWLMGVPLLVILVLYLIF